jgi:integrase
LHSYRYAWAERARAAGYPERFAQEAPGHKSAAVHWAYAKKAKVKIVTGHFKTSHLWAVQNQPV